MTHRTLKRPRRRCYHPSGVGASPYCMAPAVTAVRIRFGKKWSKPIPACEKHAATKEWYPLRGTEDKWCGVRASTMKVYEQHIAPPRKRHRASR